MYLKEQFTQNQKLFTLMLFKTHMALFLTQWDIWKNVAFKKSPAYDLHNITNGV